MSFVVPNVDTHLTCWQARHKDGSSKLNNTTRTLVRLYATKFIIHSLWVLAEIFIRYATMCVALLARPAALQLL